jgi:hypothetical protein
MPSTYRASKQDFMVWISQLVWLRGWQIERKEFIGIFASCLRTFMTQRGYKMEDRFEKEFSMWLYRLHVQEVRKNHGAPVHLPDVLHRDTDDDYERYQLIVDEDDLRKYIDPISDTDDLIADTHVANRIRYGLSEFLYRVIDIESSKQGRFIASLWDTSGSASESEGYEVRKKDDYLEDANKGFHGGRGAKV